MTKLIGEIDVNFKLRSKYSYASVLLTVLYFSSYRFNILTLPFLLLLCIKMAQLFESMYTHLETIQMLIEIKDFEYSVIVGQASGNNISETLKNYLCSQESKSSKLSNQIGLIYMDLVNNESLIDSLYLRSKILDSQVRDFMNIIAISLVSGADTKKVGLIEHENISRRIETELDIWSSYADKRLEIIMMLFIPPLIMMASGLSVGNSINYIVLGLIYNVSILIITFSVSITKKILKGSL